MNKIIKFRLPNEINKLKYSIWYKNPSDYTYDIIYIENSLHLQIRNLNNEIFLDLLISKDYPFKPYQVYKYELPLYNYNKNLSYLKWLTYKNNNSNEINFIIYWFLSIKFKNSIFMELLLNKKCLCCNSKTCISNWIPNNNISNIMEEYIINRILIFYSSKIMANHLKYIYYNLPFNYDILNLILENILIPKL
tara:strand:- start:35 stop:613 length:579 start_codon:yes stop_codon:yes gene_type:complete